MCNSSRKALVLGITLLLSVLLLCASTLSYVASAQEGDTSASAPDAQTSDTVPLSVGLPYKTEPLLGDKVIGDFVVGPGKIELQIKPGESKTIEMTVTNRTGGSRYFEIGTEDAMGSDDPTKTLVLLGDDRGPYSMKDYVSVPSKRFEVADNTRVRIPVTVTIPSDAEPGGLYGSVLVSTVSTEARAGDGSGTAPQSAIVARVGTLFFITIPGGVEKQGALKDLTTVPEKKFYQSSPITFGLLFENTGSIHLAPYGELRITNMFDEEVGYLELDPWFVLPKALRLREVVWSRDFLFGQYTATAYINRSYDDVIDEVSYTFWVLPWKPLAGAFGVLFLVFFFIRIFFKKFEFKRKA